MDCKQKRDREAAVEVLRLYRSTPDRIAEVEETLQSYGYYAEEVAYRGTTPSYSVDSAHSGRPGNPTYAKVVELVGKSGERYIATLLHRQTALRAFMRKVETALDKLPCRHKRILLLKYRDKRRTTAIANRLKISSRSTQYRLYRQALDAFYREFTRTSL